MLLDGAAKAEDKVEGGLLLDIVLGEGVVVFQLFSGEDEALLVKRDALFILDHRFLVVDGVKGFNL